MIRIKMSLLIVEFLALIATTVDGQNEVHPCNGRTVGFARDLNSCNHFWRCAVTPSTRGVCPDSNRFEPETERCVRPSNGRCFDCTAQTDYQLLSVPRACHQFTRCFNGIASLHACPRGLVFDGRRNIHNCNHRPISGGCHREDDNAVHQPIGLCPSVIGRRPMYMRDPDSCSKFYVCARPNDSPLPGHCQDDLHFNLQTGTCDVADNAGCDWDTETPSENTPGPAIPCPAEGGVFVPCRTTCNRYYACVQGGQAHLQFCVAGAIFDYPSRQCMRGGRCWYRDHAFLRPQWRSANYTNPEVGVSDEQLTIVNFDNVTVPKAGEIDLELIDTQNEIIPGDH